MARRVTLDDKVAALGDLSYGELVERWTKAHGCPPPKGVKRGLLERSAAYTLQTRYHGGMSPSGRAALRAAIKRYEGNRQTAGSKETKDPSALPLKSIPPAAAAAPLPPRPTLSPGSRLVREWHGRIHSVDVVDAGFRFEGKTYRSLSAIARQITGAQWSGPRFFGL
ncbi:DUF2924 domain-containing protein [Shinella zoogloeoides]|uniref:DUF2924 domain-containing protein n=1 Tax=Shinella zoogloeoides TaxID=352475 RepID=UPI00273F6484|nr:DUF2924 domain-containing protein [Shinella zoogloeoides]WLR91332.1 DUF2924 domain-containing protein [Shinella zoogloeoides]